MSKNNKLFSLARVSASGIIYGLKLAIFPQKSSL
jgi:hypothetical protein